MPLEVSVRRALSSDVDEITDLFRNTILFVNCKDYDEEQVKAWTAAADNKKQFLSKIKQQYFPVAVIEKAICGFASLAADGYLDLMYVHKDYQGRGLATLLIKELEAYAWKNRIFLIYSDVSLTAKAFFEKMGYVVIKENRRELDGTGFTNYTMNKSLPGA
jgi:putative acetyltransferase